MDILLALLAAAFLLWSAGLLMRATHRAPKPFSNAVSIRGSAPLDPLPPAPVHKEAA
jgi:hypothetical protein